MLPNPRSIAAKKGSAVKPGIASSLLPIFGDDAGRQAQLMNNVAVYAIADNHGIPELEELAKTKFRPLLLCAHLTNKTPISINAIFETTTNTDPGLREVKIEFCQSRVRTILDDSHSSYMLKDHAEFSLGVLRKMAHEHNGFAARMKEEKEDLFGRMSALHGELNVVLVLVYADGLKGPLETGGTRTEFENARDWLSALTDNTEAMKKTLKVEE